MKKESSIQKKSREFIAGILSITVLFTILICGIFFYYNYHNIKEINANVLEEFHSDMDRDLYNSQQFVINLYANNPDFRTLVNQTSDTYDIYQRCMRIKGIFESRTAFPVENFGFFLRRDEKNGFYSSYPVGTGFDSVSRMDTAVKNHLDASFQNGVWYVVSDELDTYLIIAYNRGLMTVGSILSLDHYADSLTSSTAEVRFLFGDTHLTDKIIRDENSWYYVASSESRWSVPVRTLEETSGSFIIQTVTAQEQLRLLINVLIGIFILFLLILVVLLILIDRNYYQLLIYPIQRISRIEDNLRNGTADEDIRSNITEYNQINDGILALIDQVTALEKESHEKEMAYQASQLQYYQLQTEPHFFLNCLKNIYALAENHQFEKIQYMITVISKHFRYIFRSNTFEIALQEELDETQCYFQLCQFSSTVPMILEMHRDPSLESHKVPPLLIQTFVENSIKYGKQLNKVLRIDVSVFKENDRIGIRITDDGIGYSPEIIQSVQTENYTQNGHIGIKNAIDRMKLLYEGRTEIRISNRETGGACTELYIPLKEVSDV